MTVLRVFVLISLVALTAKAQQNPPQQSAVPPPSCPVTGPPATPFIPPAHYERGDEKVFLLGTEKLWTPLRKAGVWDWAPHAPEHENEVQPLTEKTFWISSEFNWKTEYPPKLKVTGRRLDGVAPPLLTLRPTNAFPGPGASMLVGVYVPTPGCWEITGEYKGQKLSYIVWLQPVKRQ
jgi:hypothetical protein